MRRIKVALLALVFAATFITPIVGAGSTQALAASGHKVTGVKIASSQTPKVKVSWKKAKGAVSYQVRVGSRTLKVKKTSLAVSASAADRIQVRAVLKKGKKGSWSNAAYRAPQQVVSVKLGVVSDTQVKVTWAKVPGTATYTVTSGSKTWKTKALSAVVTADASNLIRVKAVSKAGLSGPWSKSAYRAPLRVTSVTVSAPNEDYGRVAWARQAGAIEYQVDAGGTTTTVRDPSASVFLLYGETVRVRAKGKGGFGPWSVSVAKGLSAAERANLEEDLVWYRQQLADVNADIAALDAQKSTLEYGLSVAEMYNDTLRAATIRAELAQVAADRSAAVTSRDRYAARIAEITRMLA